MTVHLIFCAIFTLQFFIIVTLSLRINSKVIFGDDFEVYSANDASSSPYVGLDSNIEFTSQFFLQKLDHSRPIDRRTWYQRYFVNDFYHEDGGPVFLFVFGESEANSKWMGKGPQWIGYAKKFNALCFGLEHRFYGQSRPLQSTNTSSLQYLTTEQVLADIAHFIEGINRYYNLSSDTKWILFGGSYAGSLVAWARMKYPHLVHGAIASSAPLLAKVDFSEYFQGVERSLNNYNHECVKNIAIANRHLRRIIRTKTGRNRVSKMFKLCSVLKDDPDDVSTLFQILADNIAYAVQYNRKNFYSMEDVCGYMNDDAFVPLERYANVNKMFLKLINESCSSHEYANTVNYWKDGSYNSSSQQSSRLWLYQTCTAYGFFQTSNNPDNLFGPAFTINNFLKICQDVFGAEIDEYFVGDAVDRTNIEYGDLKFNSSNVVFVHGRIDPWHTLGLHNRFKPATHKVITMESTAHCGDMYPSSGDDSQELTAARRQIFDILKTWLGTEDCSFSSTLEMVIFSGNQSLN